MSSVQTLADTIAAADALRCVMDDAGRLMFVSPAFAALIGRDVEDLKNCLVHEVLTVPSTEGPPWPSGYYDVDLQRPGSSPLKLRARIDPIETPGGRNFTVIWCEPEKRPEAAVPLHRFLDMSGDVWVICDDRLVCRQINATARRALNISEGQMFPLLLHAADRDAIHQQLLLFLKHKAEHEDAFEARSTGGHWLHWRYGWIENQLYMVGRDISAQREKETAMHAALQAAAQADAAKTRFLANMSHELRTPLNAMIGFSEMIQRQLLGPVGNPRYLEYAKNIGESGAHLLDLISDILDMSKIEAGKYVLNPEDVNVGKIMRLATHMLESRAEEAALRLRTEDVADDIRIHADRRALLQIILNILSNAIKFTPSGGVVSLRCSLDKGGVMLRVSDSGIGIPADKVALVTRPFEQVDTTLTRRHRGTGLGLAITKELVHLHGGTLDIDSAFGVGTVVTVRLPRQT